MSVLYANVRGLNSLDLALKLGRADAAALLKELVAIKHAHRSVLLAVLVLGGVSRSEASALAFLSVDRVKAMRIRGSRHGIPLATTTDVGHTGDEPQERRRRVRVKRNMPSRAQAAENLLLPPGAQRTALSAH